MEGDEEREATIQTKQALVLMCACSSAIGYTTPPAVLFISHLLEIYSSHLSLSDALSQVVALCISALMQVGECQAWKDGLCLVCLLD